MASEYEIFLNPMPSFGNVTSSGVLDAWREAAATVSAENYVTRHHEPCGVKLDISDVEGFLMALVEAEGNRSRAAFEPFLKRWTGERPPARVRVELSQCHSADAEVILTGLFQEMYLALNLRARGAGHLNAARCEALTNDAHLGYFGDPLESAWVEAEAWGWPRLQPVPFALSWNWLGACGFRTCSVAEDPLHRALAVLVNLASGHTNEANSIFFPGYRLRIPAFL